MNFLSLVRLNEENKVLLDGAYFNILREDILVLTKKEKGKNKIMVLLSLIPLMRMLCN